VSDKTRASKLQRISGGLMLTGGAPERGKGEETLVADIGEDDDFDYIGFNGRYLHDALGLGDQVILQIGSVDAPCRLTFATPEGVDRPFDPVEVVLMPLRV
jgi:DNA polymerase III sliding clamp (beta) subunit (PCNA family)